MKIDKDCTMAISNQQAEEMYKNSEKEMLRRQIPKELLTYIGERAYADFGSMDRTSVGKELTKLLLIAKEELDKQE